MSEQFGVLWIPESELVSFDPHVSWSPFADDGKYTNRFFFTTEPFLYFVAALLAIRYFYLHLDTVTVLYPVPKTREVERTRNLVKLI